MGCSDENLLCIMLNFQFYQQRVSYWFKEDFSTKCKQFYNWSVILDEISGYQSGKHEDNCSLESCIVQSGMN